MAHDSCKRAPSRTCTMLAAVPVERPYPLKEALYTVTSPHLTTPSKKYVYPNLTSPRASRAKLKINLFRTASLDLVSLQDKSKETPSQLKSRKARGTQSLKMGFSDMVTFYMNSKSIASKVWLTSPPENEHQTEKVFEHIYHTAKSKMSRPSLIRRSLPTLDIQPAKLQRTAACTRMSTNRVSNDGDFDLPKSSRKSKMSSLLSFTPTARPLVEKRVKRVKNLRKMPFGIHTTYESNFKERYIKDECTTDWINVNNSKRLRLSV